MAAETNQNKDSNLDPNKKDSTRAPEVLWIQPGVPKGYREVFGFSYLFPVTPDEFIDGRKAMKYPPVNPSIMWNNFWTRQVGPDRTDVSTVRKRLLDMIPHLPNVYVPEVHKEHADPIWSFDRSGGTCTELLDGRLVFIGGEYGKIHEVDHCIYNVADVVVVKAPPKTDPPPLLTPECITIYGYPLEVFPPTDRHTSTFYRDPMTGKEMIFIIGGLGYPERVILNRTDVYKVDLSDNFKIHRMETSGTGPTGLTYLHRATLLWHDGQSFIRIITMPKTYKLGPNSPLPFGIATREFVAEMVATDFFAQGVGDEESPMTDDQKAFTLRISDMRWV